MSHSETIERLVRELNDTGNLTDAGFRELDTLLRDMAQANRQLRHLSDALANTARRKLWRYSPGDIVTVQQPVPCKLKREQIMAMIANHEMVVSYAVSYPADAPAALHSLLGFTHSLCNPPTTEAHDEQQVGTQKAP